MKPIMPKHDSETAGKRTVILVIDDEASVLKEVSGVLAKCGHDCRSSSDPETAFERAVRLQPDLIICDINLGEASGFELCERIQNEGQLAEVPVIFLSGAQIPDVVRRSHEAGGTYYLRKPFDRDVLVDLVDRALWMPHLVRDRVRGTQPMPA